MYNLPKLTPNLSVKNSISDLNEFSVNSALERENSLTKSRWYAYERQLQYCRKFPARCMCILTYLWRRRDRRAVLGWSCTRRSWWPRAYAPRSPIKSRGTSTRGRSAARPSPPSLHSTVSAAGASSLPTSCIHLQSLSLSPLYSRNNTSVTARQKLRDDVAAESITHMAPPGRLFIAA